ncbi:hypothetical protein SRHO_G00149680 [Serrasalmus rhombeus]
MKGPEKARLRYAFRDAADRTLANNITFSLFTQTVTRGSSKVAHAEYDCDLALYLRAGSVGRRGRWKMDMRGKERRKASLSTALPRIPLLFSLERGVIRYFLQGSP